MAKRGAPKDSVDHVIVIGASAGGVDALTILVESLPRDLPAPVVIAQHLDPTRPSQLAKILSRHAEMPVKSVETREPLSPGTIYVVPANRHVSLTNQDVRVHADADGERRPLPSVDLLLTSAANVFGEQVIAVILSGSGSDGAAGAHKVKEAGGTIVIQDPATAAFPSMPLALSPPLVDAALPLDRIGELLVQLVKTSSDPGQPSNSELPLLLERLRTRRGIDFSAYKTPTIERRLRRRMATVGVSSFAEYLDLLDRDQEEEQQLIAHFLIKVTRFFRDPALFTTLRDQIIPELVDDAREGKRELRLWSAGCATGEEAYSLALLVAEVTSRHAEPPNVRIFATDLDDTALAFARRGLYPASALEDTPSNLVGQFFTERDGSYEVRKLVRSMIVFGNHDLAQRPPFPHTDLVLCRNVLIYFTPELQRRAIDIFSYSLRNGGYLVLGKSETTRPADGAYVPVDARMRIYRREGRRNPLPPSRMTTAHGMPGYQEAVPTRVPEATGPRPHKALEKAQLQQPSDTHIQELIRRLPVGLAVVNASYDVELINGVARELLGIYGLALGQDLIHLSRQELAGPLRRIIDQTSEQGGAESNEEIVPSQSLSGVERILSLRSFPNVVNESGTVESVLIMIQDVTPSVVAQRETQAAASRASQLESANRELLAANREMTTSLDTLRTQGDDLRLSTAAAQVWAEEIETLNEELQSSNEELETLHEEAQATVEELNVANEELEARAAETKEIAAISAAERARLAAVLAAMDDAVIAVGRDGQTVLTNPAYDSLRRLLGGPLVPADEYGFPLPEDSTPVQRAVRGEEFRMDFTARAADGTRYWFDATGRTLAPEEAGAGVVVIRDITDRSVRKLQEEFLQWAGHELRTPLTALQTFLQLAARRAADGDDSRLRDHLDAAIGQTRRQAGLIDELLDASRLKSGRILLRTEPLDMVPLVRHVSEVAQVLARGQEIVVQSEDDPVMVAGDSSRLEQVVLNLLLNAISYAPETDRIEVGLERENGNARITVRDFGPGIRPDQIEGIFQRFSRGDSTPHAATSGLGLGLYIAREIVRAHSGNLDVRSVPGEGATFTITLPLVPGTSAVQEPGE